MAYSYDRTAAAHMELHQEWREIVDRHRQAEEKDLEALLKKTVNYLKSVGYDLDLRKSYLSKYYAGSDGIRREGMLTITEREENTTQSKDADSVRAWVYDALGVHGHPKLVSSGPAKNRYNEPLNTWAVDITQS